MILAGHTEETPLSVGSGASRCSSTASTALRAAVGDRALGELGLRTTEDGCEVDVAVDHRTETGDDDVEVVEPFSVALEATVGTRPESVSRRRPVISAISFTERTARSSVSSSKGVLCRAFPRQGR